MEQRPVLSDKTIFPTPEVICSHIGKTAPLWDALFDYIHKNHPDFTEEWRFYNDGKQWLLKVARKKKTVFWLSVLDGGFRTGFYFTDKAAPVIARSGLSAELKSEFKDGKTFGKMRGLHIRYKNKRDVDYGRELIEIKLSLK